MARMGDDPTAADLVICARGGDQQAWTALVERYAPLVQSICRRHRLGCADTEDVSESVWCSWWSRSAPSTIRPRSIAGWPPQPSENVPGCGGPEMGPQHIRHHHARCRRGFAGRPDRRPPRRPTHHDALRQGHKNLDRHPNCILAPTWPPAPDRARVSRGSSPARRPALPMSACSNLIVI
jgi:hypothetical protein